MNKVHINAGPRLTALLTTVAKNNNNGIDCNSFDHAIIILAMANIINPFLTGEVTLEPSENNECVLVGNERFQEVINLCIKLEKATIDSSGYPKPCAFTVYDLAHALSTLINYSQPDTERVTEAQLASMEPDELYDLAVEIAKIERNKRYDELKRRNERHDIIAHITTRITNPFAVSDK